VAELRTLFEQWEARLAIITGGNVVTLPPAALLAKSNCCVRPALCPA
jgi:hypothetical protein